MKKRKNYPNRIFATSDIHGCNQTFSHLLSQVQFSSDDHLLVIGDAINKGPHTKQVLTTLWELHQAHQLTYIRGNHEQALLDCYFSLPQKESFIDMGGKAMLESFNISSVRQIPSHFIDLIQQTLPIYITSKVVCVHGGLNLSKKYPYSPTKSMLYRRKAYEQKELKRLGDRLLLHGHQPITVNEQKKLFAERHTQKIINLDSGCAYRNQKGKGYLSLYEITTDTLYQEKNKWD